MAVIKQVKVGSSNYDISAIDTNVIWGEQGICGGVSPIGTALSIEHGANRLAYLNPAAITIEYSENGGSSYSTKSVTDSEKIKFVTTEASITVGNSSTVTTNQRTRILLTAQNGTTGYVYTRPRRMLINVSTPHGLQVQVEYKQGASGAAWKNYGTFDLQGWSGWNDVPINIGTFGGSTSQTSNNWYIRLTFSVTSVNSNHSSQASQIIGLRLFGETSWISTSNLGRTGHLYSYNEAQEAFFPASVTASSFKGACDSAYALIGTATGSLVWEGDHMLHSTDRAGVNLHFGTSNLYRYNTSTNTYNKIWCEGDSVTGAVWNDYAEYRESNCTEYGRVLVENGDDTLSISTERLQPFAGVSSDTWGFCQGETEKAKTPIAVAGRVLVYPYRDRNEYKPGDVVCAAPNGTVDIMTREEVINYPDRIVGTVSCVPNYEEWGSGDRKPAKVNGRIWIKV